MPVTPGDDDDASPWGTHSRQLSNKPRLVWHVLPTLERPHQIELVVLIGLLQCISHLHVNLLPCMQLTCGLGGRT